MAKLIVSRPRRLVNYLRRYLILVDGRIAASIANGKSAEIELAPGRHQITARLDFGSSQPVEIEAGPDGVLHLIVGSNQERRPLLKTAMFLTVLAPALIFFLAIAAGFLLFRDPLEGSWFIGFVAPMIALPGALELALKIICRDGFLYLEDPASPDPAGRRAAPARSEPLRFRITIRGLMVAVAILAILFGAGVEWMRFTRRGFYQSKARSHSQYEANFRDFQQTQERWVAEFEKARPYLGASPIRPALSKTATMVDYHVAMRRKYEEAAARRAFRVEPDPPPPPWP